MEQKLIEGNFPCQQVGAETRRERDTGMAPPTHRLHVYWARRPLTPSRAAILGSILPATVSSDEFLRDLGIRKYQIEIDGSMFDLPKSFITEHGTRFQWSKELERLVTKDNKVRQELREMLATLLAENAELQDNEAIKKLAARAKNIDINNVPIMQEFTAVQVAADPAWFNEILELFKDVSGRVPNLYGYSRAYENLSDKDYSNYTVLDPTAGGGSIPFEAMRLGCNVIANDLNPVATGIEYASLRYPAQYGLELIPALEKYSEKLISDVADKMAPYFAKNVDDGSEEELSYLYCREVTCPSCGERAPLLNSFALAKKADGWMVVPEITGAAGHRVVHFRPVRLTRGRGPHGEDPEVGTVTKGVGRCLHCGQAIASEEIKAQARGESPYGVWRDRLYAVVGVRIQPKCDREGRPLYYASGAHKGELRTEKVTFFREPTAADIAATERAAAELERSWDELADRDLIPTERIPEMNDMRPIMYGMERWCDMFTPRQLLGHLTAMATLADMLPAIQSAEGAERGAAIVHYLQYMLDKCIDYNSRQTRWIPQRGSVSGTFSRHDFSLKWTFGELIYTGENSGLAWGRSQVLDAYKGICELLAGGNVKPARVINGSAANIDLADASVDVICVDPPYYNNVQYAELADYFYVWQKRTLRALYPDVFSRRLTNKQDEAVANPVRDGSAREADRVYEERMSEIFAECHRVLRADGIMTMMFTHKTQAAWETLTRALIETGWIISSSFPVDSEFAAALNQKDLAAAASSIFIACRKRELGEREPAIWAGLGGTGVRADIRAAVARSLREYAPLHLNAVDEMVASYGNALQVLSANWPVMDGDTLVTPAAAMREASTVVAQYQLTAITGGRLGPNDLHSEASIALTLYGLYGLAQFPYDDALSLSKSLNIRLETRPAGYHSEADMIGIADERTGRTRRDDEEEGYFAPLVKRGSKLRLVAPEERHPRRLASPQQEWDILCGMIVAFREGDIPVARAYLQRHSDGHEARILDMLRVWADKAATESLRKEAQRMLFGLR